MVRGGGEARRDEEPGTHPGRRSAGADEGAGDLGGRTGLYPLPPRLDGHPRVACSRQAFGRETEEKRYERYRKDAREPHDLAGVVTVAGLGRRDVRVFETTDKADGAEISTYPLSHAWSPA